MPEIQQSSSYLKRLERYGEFVDPYHTGQPYDPRQGLERLLSVLTPDPKGLVLAAMDGGMYFTRTELYSRTLEWIENLGLPIRSFPIIDKSSWAYLERREKNGEIVDGSLVEEGAVVKKTEDWTLRTYYSRSEAGAALALPLIQQAIEFVYRARNSSIPHKYDSMWRVIGNIQSTTSQRRPLALFDVIDFLISNPGEHREKDIVNETKMNPSRIDHILYSLAERGVITAQSPTREVEGRHPIGYVVYQTVDGQTLKDIDIDAIYQKIKRDRPHFDLRGCLIKVINYIQEHPDQEYELNGLSEAVRVYKNKVGVTLSHLEFLGLLTRPYPGWKTGEKLSSFSKNDLTDLFYDIVCLPAKEIAETLTPLPLKTWDPVKVAVFMANYQEERSLIGPQGGEEARINLLTILPTNGDEIKASYIHDLYNSRFERALTVAGLTHQLEVLIADKLVERTRPGFYRMIS